MKLETIYFPMASTEYTENVIQAVRHFLNDNPEMEHIIVATTGGETGIAVARAFNDKNVVVVSHMTGFRAPNENELSDKNREELENLGAHILTTTHALAGVSRGIRNALGTYTLTELLAVAYRTFGQGTKVSAEIALMAADAGLVPVDKDVVSIGGTSRGADTAWVVQPANTSSFPQLKMRACICKPIEF